MISLIISAILLATIILILPVATNNTIMSAIWKRVPGSTLLERYHPESWHCAIRWPVPSSPYFTPSSTQVDLSQNHCNYDLIFSVPSHREDGSFLRMRCHTYVNALTPGSRTVFRGFGDILGAVFRGKQLLGSH